MDDLRQQVSDAIDTEWIKLASRLPEGTPDYLTDHLRLAYLEAIRDDGVNAIFAVREYSVNGRVVRITARLRPHIVTAFIRMATELRHTRSPKGLGERSVESGKVPKGIVAAQSRARRLGLH